MKLLEKITTVFMFCLLSYQIFLAHFHSKNIEKFMSVRPFYDEKHPPSPPPVTKPVNNFYPHTYIGQDFDPNSVITQIT